MHRLDVLCIVISWLTEMHVGEMTMHVNDVAEVKWYADTHLSDSVGIHLSNITDMHLSNITDMHLTQSRLMTHLTLIPIVNLNDLA